jgi:PAS domain S-box-containing protein
MPWNVSALIACLVTSLILSLAYLVCFVRNRTRTLAAWAAGWAICSLRYGLSLLAGTGSAVGGSTLPGQPGPLLQAVILATCLASSSLLWWGLVSWLEQPVNWRIKVALSATGVLWAGVLFWGGFLLALPIELGLGLGLGLLYFEKAQARLENSQRRLQAIFDNASLGIGMENGRGRFIQVNQRLASMLGYTPEEALNLSFNDITYPDDLPLIKPKPAKDDREDNPRGNGNGSSKNSILGANGNGNGGLHILPGNNGNGTGNGYFQENSQVEKRFIRKNGSIFWGGLSLSAIRSPAGDVVTFAGMITDLSQRKQTEEALQLKTSQQERLITTARQLTQSLDVHQVLGQIAAGAWEILGANSCAIYLVDPDGKTLTPVVAIDPTYADATMAAPIPVEESFTGKSVKARRGLIFNNAHLSTIGVQIPGTPAREEEHIMVAPLMVDDQVLGAMCLNQLNTPFTNEDLTLAETFAAYAATALKNAQAHDRLQAEVSERRRAEEALRASETRYRSLFEDSPIPLWEQDFSTVKMELDRLQQSGVEDLRNYLNEHPHLLYRLSGFIQVLDANRATIDLYRAGNHLGLQGGLACLDTEDSPIAYRESFVAMAEGLRCFEIETTNRALSGEEIQIVLRWSVAPGYEDSYAKVLVSTIDITRRKQAEQALQRKTFQQDRLIETARHLTQSLDFDQVLRRIATGVREIMDANSCTIYMLEPEGHLLVPVVAIDPAYEGEVLACPVEVDGSFTGQAVKARRGMIFNDAGELEGGKHIPGTPFREQENLLATPLIVDGRVLGAMVVDQTSDPFSEEDLALAETFAAYASTALKNAQVHDQLQNEVMERRRAEVALQRKTLQQQRLIETARQLTQSLEVNQVLRRIVAGAYEILEANGCTIYMLESDGHTLSPVVTIDPQYEAEIMSCPIQVEGSFTGKGILARHGVIFNNAGEIEGGAQIPGTPVHEQEHIIVAPLIIDGQVLGAMCIDQSRQPFTEDDLALAETFATYASTALKNAQAHDRLQKEVEERRLAEEALRLSEERFRISLWTSPDAITINRMRDGAFVYVNQGFTALTGYTLEEVQDPNWHEIDLWEDPTDRQQMIDNLNRDGAVRNMEARFRLKDGSVHTGLSSSTIINLDGEPQLLLVTRDIEDRIQAERALHESEERYRSLFETNSSVMLLIDPNTLKIVDANPAACHYYGYSNATLTSLSMLEITGKPDAEIHKELNNALCEDHQYHLSQHVQASGRVRDVEVYSGPIALDGEDLIYAIIHDVTDRIQREREMETIVRVATALRSAQTRDEMFPIILNQVVELLKADGAAIVMRDPATGKAAFELAFGTASELTGRRLRPGESISSLVLESGQVYINNNAACDPQNLSTDPSRTPSGLVVIPLIARDETIGALSIGRNNPLGEEDLRLMVTVGEIAANAIHRATLHEETERQLKRLDALHTIDKAITTYFNLDITLNVVLDQVRDQLGVDAAAILLVQDDQSLAYSAERGFRSDQILRYVLPGGTGFSGKVALDRRFLEIQDIMAEVQADGLFRYPVLERYAPNHPSPAPAIASLPSLYQSEQFTTFFGMPLEAKGVLKGVLELYHRSHFETNQEWLAFLDTLARQTAIAIDNASLFNELQTSNLELRNAYDTTLQGWAHALELRDKETEGHSQRVTDLTLSLASAMGISGDDLVQIQRGTALHDIGKMGISDSILFKPGPLTEDEWEIMRQHPTLAYNLLSSIPFLRPALDIPYCHHEKWDGSGYPRGLKGNQIPLPARIFAIVDVWDALINDRPYRKAWSEDAARQFLLEQSGKHFDPQVVEAFMKTIPVL